MRRVFLSVLSAGIGSGLGAGLGIGAGFGLVGGAGAQDEAPVLSGPDASGDSSGASSRATLVERDYQGRLRELEVRAEVAALGLLGLSEEQRAQAEALVAERGALVEQIVFDNLALLTRVQTARANAEPGGPPLGGDRGLIRDIFEMTAPLREQEPLAQRLAPTLPEGSREAYLAIVEEWYAAKRESQPKGQAEHQQDRGTDVSGMSGMSGAAFDAIRTELRAAYDRGVAGRMEMLDGFIATLDPSPELEGRIREMIRASFVETQGKPSPTERAQLIREIFAILPSAERRRAIAAYRDTE